MNSSFSSVDSSIVCVVIVTYNPVIVFLQQVLEKLKHQVGGIVIVDNHSEKPFKHRFQHFSFDYIQLNKNMGIDAHNYGIDFAVSKGFQYVVMLDDDSIPSENMVSLLLSAHLKLSRAGLKVAAVGPRIVDSDNGLEFPFGYLSKYVMKRDVPVLTDRFSKLYYATHVITSASLVNLLVFQDIGPLKKDWFLCHIDTEWCTRAIKKGYQCFGVGNAKLYQRMGNKLLCLNFFGIKIFLPTYSHDRLYYIFRNEVWVIKCGPLSYIWSVLNLCKRVFLYAVFTKPRLEAWNMILKGLKDGILKKPLD